MVRGPIQQRGQRPLSPRAPRSLGSYAVLAALSSCYPPLLGRLPTCYSPVRRCTKSRRTVLARLACVKHAASVRSEPGSNSPVKKSLNHNTRPKSRFGLDSINQSLTSSKSSEELVMRNPNYLSCYSVFKERGAPDRVRRFHGDSE